MRANVFVVGIVLLMMIVVITVDGTSHTPLLLIPGFAASILEAYHKSDLTKPLHRAYESYPDSNDRMKDLWIESCGSCNVPKQMNESLVILPSFRDFGLYAIDNLNPEGNPDRLYFHDLIIHLKKLGYVPGETLFAFPYDWRLSALTIANDLESYVLKIRKQTGSSQINIISHSMGGIITKWTMLTKPGFAAFVNTYIPIATPWQGTGMNWAISALFGSNLNNKLLDPEVVRTLLLASPSTYQGVSISQLAKKEMYPYLPSFSYKLNGDLVQLNANQTVELVGKLLFNHQIEFNGKKYPIPFDTAQLNILNNATVKFIYESSALQTIQPRMVYNIIGVLQDTPTSVSFETPISNVQELLTSTPTLTDYESGDGVCTVESATDSGFNTLFRATFPDSHNGLLRDPLVHETISQFLGHTCSFEGNWTIYIQNDPKPVEHIRVFQSFGWKAHAQRYSMTGQVWGNSWKGSLVGDYGNGTFIWEQAPDCLSFNGTWRYPWSSDLHWRGVRVTGKQCTKDVQCTVANGQGTRSCIHGYLSSNCLVSKCNAGYTMSIGQPVRESFCVRAVVSATREPKAYFVSALLSVFCAFMALIYLVMHARTSLIFGVKVG